MFLSMLYKGLCPLLISRSFMNGIVPNIIYKRKKISQIIRTMIANYFLSQLIDGATTAKNCLKTLTIESFPRRISYVVTSNVTADNSLVYPTTSAVLRFCHDFNMLKYIIRFLVFYQKCPIFFDFIINVCGCLKFGQSDCGFDSPMRIFTLIFFLADFVQRYCLNNIQTDKFNFKNELQSTIFQK